MTVIAFRPRSRSVSERSVPVPVPVPVPVVGSFRSPSGRTGRMEGFLRVHRLVIAPRGAFVSGVFTGELRDVDGSLVGVDSRRATAAADLVRERGGLAPVVRPFQLDLMGLTVEVDAIRIDPMLAPGGRAGGRSGRLARPGFRRCHTRDTVGPPHTGRRVGLHPGPPTTSRNGCCVPRDPHPGGEQPRSALGHRWAAPNPCPAGPRPRGLVSAGGGTAPEEDAPTTEEPEDMLNQQPRTSQANDADNSARPGSTGEVDEVPLSGLSRTSWKYTARKAWTEFMRDECTDLAAALTYYAVLSLFPALLAWCLFSASSARGNRPRTPCWT